MGRWVGGWVGWVGYGKVEEEQAVRMSSCKLEMGGWVDEVGYILKATFLRIWMGN